jgi:hypothetical protein
MRAILTFQENDVKTKRAYGMRNRLVVDVTNKIYYYIDKQVTKEALWEPRQKLLDVLGGNYMLGNDITWMIIEAANDD